MEFLKAFQEIDTNFDGVISKSDLVLYRQSKGYTDKFEKKWLALFDANNDDLIQFQEFCDVLGLNEAQIEVIAMKKKHSQFLPPPNLIDTPAVEASLPVLDEYENMVEPVRGDYDNIDGLHVSVEVPQVMEEEIILVENHVHIQHTEPLVEHDMPLEPQEASPAPEEYDNIDGLRASAEFAQILGFNEVEEEAIAVDRRQVQYKEVPAQPNLTPTVEVEYDVVDAAPKRNDHASLLQHITPTLVDEDFEIFFEDVENESMTRFIINKTRDLLQIRYLHYNEIERKLQVCLNKKFHGQWTALHNPKLNTKIFYQSHRCLHYKVFDERFIVLVPRSSNHKFKLFGKKKKQHNGTAH